MTAISSGESPVADWETETIRLGVNEIITRCELDVQKLSTEICDLTDNLRVIEQLYVRLKEKHPKAVTNIWLERLLTSILTKEYGESETIVRDRMNSRDSGGFYAGSKSFYELANEYLQAVGDIGA